MMSASESPDYITVHGASFESMAMDTPLPFEPPLAYLSSDPEAFRFEWTLLQYVFEFDDPEQVEPFSSHSTDAADEIRRYIVAAMEMATSPFLAYPASMNVTFGRDVREKVETDFPHRENVRGFSTHLRQFHSRGRRERGTFERVIAELHRSQPNERRQQVLALWERAENKLRKRPVREWVGLKLIREKKMPGNPPTVPGMHLPFMYDLMQTFNYGELIHWGSQRGELAALMGTTEFEAAEAEMKLYQGMADLAFFYMGFAVLTDTLMQYGLVQPSSQR